MTIEPRESGAGFVSEAPPFDVRRINAAVKKTFAEGAKAVLIDFSTSAVYVAADEQRLAISSATISGSDVLLITAATDTAAGCGGGLQEFLGPYGFSEDELIWSRRPGYRYGDEGDLDVVGLGAVCGADVLLVSAGAWLRIGPFDVRAPCWLSPLEWTMRAGAAGLNCRSRVLRFAEWRVPTVFAGIGTSAEDIIGAYRLAWKHRLPCSAISLFARRVMLALVGSYPKPRFRKDYGVTIGPTKRLYWYLRNLRTIRRLAAVSREVMALLKATILPSGGP